MSNQEFENLFENNNQDQVMPENIDLSEFEVVDDDPNAHNSHRRISRYGRSSQRFNNTQRGGKS